MGDVRAGRLRARRERVGYRPHLDGLRTIAVYLVVAFHAGVHSFSGGFIGVDIFFVLSGYLVTGILLRDLNSNGSVVWSRFYARRSRRILPAAVVTLTVTAIVYSLVASPAAALDAASGFRASALYVANWHFIHQATDYFAADVNTSPVLHFWSLAVEEQFYVVWPLLITGLYLATQRLGRWRWWTRRGAIALATIASAAAALHIATTNLPRAYYGTDTRAYQLLLGALLAITPQIAAMSSRYRPAARILAIATTAALVALATSTVHFGAITRGIAVAGATTLLIAALTNTHGGIIERALSLPPVTYLGRISYGTYLWHWPVIVIATIEWSLGPIALLALTTTVATALAAISFALLEQPIRNSPTLDRYKRPAIALGLTASLVTGALFLPVILRRDTNTSVAHAETTNAKLLDWQVAQKDAFHEWDWDCLHGPLERCTLTHGNGLHVLLMGDSHAAMWAPSFIEIAKKESWNLVLASAPGCPWQRPLHWPGVLFTGCPEHHADWFKRLVPEVDPDLVILVDKDYDSPRFGHPITDADGKSRTFGAAGYEQTLIDASRSTIRGLQTKGRRIVILEPTPLSKPFNPIDCLSEGTTPEKCTFRADPGPSRLEQYYRQAAGTLDDVSSIDLDTVVCPRLPTCDAIVHDIIVVRDGQAHLTQTFARSQATSIEARFRKLGLVN